jgi:hypothetical protein
MVRIRVYKGSHWSLVVCPVEQIAVDSYIGLLGRVETETSKVEIRVEWLVSLWSIGFSC